MHHNLYRIDDVLLRAGAIASIFAVLMIGGLYAMIEREGLALLTLFGLVAAVACPLALLGAGWKMRRREKLLVELWRIIEAQGQVSIQQLATMSSLGRRQLGAAIQRINQRGNGVLLWDEAAGVVRDGRVQRHAATHSEDCASCGGSVNIEVSTGQTDYVCPYCGGGLDCARINPLLQELQARETVARSAHPSVTTPGSKRFSVVLFAVLLLVFWPAAIFYAVKTQNAASA